MRGCRQLVVALLTALFACRSENPGSSDVTLVASTPTCAQCEIVLDTLITLTGPAEAFIEWPQSAWLDSRGRVFLAQPNKRIPPAVFGPDGRFLQFLGREGDGPGEFRYAAHIKGDGRDSVFIADWGTARLSVFGPDLRFVRSFTFPTSVHDLALLTDSSVVSNSGRSSAGRGPILSFTRQGLPGKAFGPPSRGEFDYQFHLAASASGGFWAVRLLGRHLWGYVQPDSGSTWYESRPPWYTGFSDDPSLRTPPPSYSAVRGIWEGADGLVWLAVQVADSAGKPALDTIRPEGVPVVVPRDPRTAYDMILEALDPATSRVVAVKRFPDLYTVSAGSGRMIHVEETETGLRFMVVRFRLVRR